MMMNWNKQKSHHSLINHILPTSWISRLKPTKGSCDSVSSKGNKTGQLGSPFSTEGRFYSADGDEAYWRLSFGDEEADTVKMFSRENSSKSYDVVCKPQFSPEKSAMRRKKVRGFAELKRQSFEEREEITAEAEMQPERVICSTKNFCPASPHMLNSKLRAVIVEDYSENEHRRTRKCQRKRRKVAGRSKSYSPRTGARTECKIKALEDIKKAKKMKKKRNAREQAVSNTDTEGEEGLGDLTGLDGYAVIKNSANPTEDFRESMVEMILENDIERPEELEELLTCYLTLNDDKYHDLIVKVFREVWLQLNEICIASILQDECFYQH